MTTALSETQKHKICQDALSKKHALEVDFIELGALLYRIREERLYEAGWTSWEEYQDEFRMSYSSISRLIDIYETFVLRYKFAPARLAAAGGWTVVAELLPRIAPDSPKAQVADLLSTALAQTRQHLRATLRAAKKGAPDCKHKENDFYVLKIYRCCGEREVIEDSRHEK